MTIAYCVNIWNHYQDAFCRKMMEKLGGQFKMVLFTPIDELMTHNGTKSGGCIQPWVSQAPNDDWIIQPPQTALEHINGKWNRFLEDADIAIVGYCNHISRESLRNREKAGKKTFFMGERLFKDPIAPWDFFSLRKLRRWWFLHRLLSGANTYYLTISHYGVEDLKFLHVCKNRIFQWGYFPNISNLYPVRHRSEKVRIGWCGRMIDWKHVEYIVQGVNLLKPEIRKMCEVVLVGEGPEKSHLIEMTHRLNLSNVVKFETYKPVSETMDFMRSLDIYIFASDRGEGWGVALNEAMDKGCVPIANVEAGATLELVDDGINGFVFKQNDIDRVAHTIEKLVFDRKLLSKMSYLAWKKMQEWSPGKAAGILMQIVDGQDAPLSGIGRLRG